MSVTESVPQRAAIRTAWVTLSRAFGLVSGLFAFGLYVYLLVNTAQGHPVEPSRELLMLQYLAVIAFIVSGAWAWWTEHQIVKGLRRQLAVVQSQPTAIGVPKGFRAAALAFEAQVPKLPPAAERRLIDALKALRTKHSHAHIRHSSPAQQPITHTLIEIFGKCRWNSSHSEISLEERGSPPEIGTEVSGTAPALVSAVANALVEAGFPSVRTRHDGTLPVEDEHVRSTQANTIRITLGHPPVDFRETDR